MAQHVGVVRGRYRGARDAAIVGRREAHAAIDGTRLRRGRPRGGRALARRCWRVDRIARFAGPVATRKRALLRWPPFALTFPAIEVPSGVFDAAAPASAW